MWNLLAIVVGFFTFPVFKALLDLAFSFLYENTFFGELLTAPGTLFFIVYSLIFIVPVFLSLKIVDLICRRSRHPHTGLILTTIIISINCISEAVNMWQQVGAIFDAIAPPIIGIAFAIFITYKIQKKYPTEDKEGE